MRAVPTSWPTTGVSVLDPASSQGVDGTRHTLCSSVTTTSWWNVSTPVDNLPAFRSVAMCQVGRRKNMGDELHRTKMDRSSSASRVKGLFSCSNNVSLIPVLNCKCKTKHGRDPKKQSGLISKRKQHGLNVFFSLSYHPY